MYTNFITHLCICCCHYRARARVCVCVCIYIYSTHTHTHIYIYIYIANVARVILHIYKRSKKVKCSRYRPGVAQKVGRGIALLFHDRGTRRGWVVSSTPRPHFTTGKDPVPILQEAGWAPGPVWTGGKSRPHRDSIPDRPAPSQSLYLLSYPAHTLHICKQSNYPEAPPTHLSAPQEWFVKICHRLVHLYPSWRKDIKSGWIRTHIFLSYVGLLLTSSRHRAAATSKGKQNSSISTQPRNLISILPSDTPTIGGSRILFLEALMLKYSCVSRPSSLGRTNSRGGGGK